MLKSVPKNSRFGGQLYISEELRSDANEAAQKAPGKNP